MYLVDVLGIYLVYQVVFCHNKVILMCRLPAIICVDRSNKTNKQMKVDPRSYERNYMQLRKEAWEKFRTSNKQPAERDAKWHGVFK